ncbi:hypothetical protein IAU59_004025 [Kwoniella sp. CBS 9459]
MAISPKLYSFLCACYAALGAMPLGYDLGVISYTIVTDDFLRVIGMDTPETYNDNYIGFIVSSMLLGAFVGSIPASLIADAFSRRTAISVAGAIFIVGGIMQTACQNRETMLAGRFFSGLGIGQLGVLCPMYQSEIAPPSARGRLGATYQFFLGIGVIAAGWIAYGATHGSPGTALSWRLPLGFQVAPAVPLVLLTSLLPESPRWLMIKGRHEEALQTLARLHSRGNINDPFVQGEFQDMKGSVDSDAALDQSWGQIFYNKTNLRRTMYGIIIQFSGQMTGVSAIQYYAPTIFASAGFENNALLINSIYGIMGLVGEVLCILFLDRFGRRWTFISGNALTGLYFAVVTALAKRFTEGTGTRPQGIAFVALLYMYNITFSAAIGPLSWLLPVEIMNTATRAKAVSLTTMSTWIANFMIGQITPHAIANIGWKYYLVFTIGGFTNALTFWAILPETKGRTLEEMDHLFTDTHWFVPAAKMERLSANTRERHYIENHLETGGKLGSDDLNGHQLGGTHNSKTDDIVHIG